MKGLSTSKIAETLWGNSDIGYLLVDSNGKIADDSGLLEDRFGFKSPFVGSALSVCLPAPVAKSVNRMLLLATNQNQSFEQKIALAESYKWLRIKVMPYADTFFLVSFEHLLFPIMQRERGFTRAKKSKSAKTFSGDATNASVDLFERIFHYSPLPISISDLKTGEYFNVNDNFLKIFGFSRDEIIGQTSINTKILTKEERSRLVRETLRQGGIKGQEFFFRNRKGEILYFLLYTEVITFNDRKCLISTFYDITQQKTAQAELIISERRFKLLSDNVGEVFFIRDLAWERLLYVNPAFEKIWGIPVETVLKDINILLNTIHPEDRQIFNSYIQHEPEQITDHAAEFRIIRPADSAVKWLRKTSFAVKDSTGKPFRVVGIISDITKQKEAEERLVQSERMLKSLSTHLSEGIFRLRADNGFVFVNSAFARLFGYQSSHEIIHAPFASLFAKKEEETQFRQLLLQNGVVKDKEICFRRKGEGTFWGLISCVQTVAEEGHICFDGSIMDITNRKLYEELLQEKNAELKKANAELDRFVYSASHELRSPLSSIMGLVHLAMLETKDKNVRKYLSLINESGERLDKFLGELKSYTSNVHTDLSIQSVDFQKIISSTIEYLRYIPNSHKIKYDVRVNVTEYFYTDVSRLKTIFTHLIGNAIRYHNFMKENPMIQITVKQTENAVQVTVSDNGNGIEKQHLEKIFEMFYRASENSEGTGLGLYITQETVKKLGGNITVSSKIGKGTRFTFVLPNMRILQNEFVLQQAIIKQAL